MKNGKVAVGIVGCGQISQTHLKAMHEAGVLPVAFCDIAEDLARARAEEFGADGARTFAYYNDMLAVGEIDVIAITTPPFLHLEQVVAALEAGKFVYSEKPVCFHLADFQRIFAAEESSGTRAFFTTSRFRAKDGLLMKAYMDEGRIGDVYRVDVKHLRGRGRPGIEFQPSSRWFADRSKAITGISGDMGMYFMDRAFHLTGWPEITSVSGQVYKQFPHDLPPDVTYDVEEHMVFLARTAGDLTFTFEFANISHHEWHNSILLLGMDGMLKGNIEMDGVELRTEREPWKWVVETPSYADNTSGDTHMYRGLQTALSAGDAGLRDEELSRLGTTSHEAYEMHRVLQMAFSSSRERKEISIADIDESAEIFPGL